MLKLVYPSCDIQADGQTERDMRTKTDT